MIKPGDSSKCSEERGAAEQDRGNLEIAILGRTEQKKIRTEVTWGSENRKEQRRREQKEQVPRGPRLKKEHLE